MRSRRHYVWKSLAMRLPALAADMVRNGRHVRGARRVLVVQHVAKSAYVFRDFLAWVSDHVPHLRRAMEFRRLPCRRCDLSRYALHLCWAGDTMDLWSPNSYQQALELQQRCSRQGIPTVNRVDLLSHSAKRRSAELMRAVGVRAPRAAAVENLQSFLCDRGGLSFPLLVREDRGHGQPAIFVESDRQLGGLDLSGFRRPIAVEYIDTRSPEDGFYRKYRYVLAGHAGVPRHMIVNSRWEVRPEQRLSDARLRREELDYVNRPDPNHELLDRARQALGLDVVGFDYSYDHFGHLVMWEANPFPNLNYPKNRAAAHLSAAIQRSFALVARLYCQRARIAIPPIINAQLGNCATLAVSQSVRSRAACPPRLPEKPEYGPIDCQCGVDRHDPHA